MNLDEADVEAIARRVAELLEDAALPESVRLVDAAELARRLAVERDWVYAHARELGAIRLGGPRGRLRFDLHRVRRDLLRQQPDAEPPRARTRPAPKRRPGGVELLPYEES